MSKKEWTLEINESIWEEFEGYTDDGEIKKLLE
jgi:hypothetical protein